MTGIKHIDIAEFQSLGFLQEANRLFFHPHGLALEITTVTTPGYRSISLTQDQYEALGAILASINTESDDPGLRDAFARAAKHEPGDKWISGVWDYRDDPEGIVFGLGDYDDSHERAQRVAAERAKHAEARARLFGAGQEYPWAAHGLPYSGGEDIERLDWMPSRHADPPGVGATPQDK